jgi:PAS domain S-box-containing protein
MFSNDARVRLFLAFLVLVLVLVNSQSLQLSSESRTFLTASFDERLESRARLVAAALARLPGERDLALLNRFLEDQARSHRLRSACILDWNARLLTGGACEPPRGEAFDRLDREGRRRLLEEGWATTEVSFPYDVDKAEAAGYLVLPEGRRGSDDPASRILRVVMPAAGIAAVNRRFRTTLIYQVSALSLVLLAVVLFFHSLVAPRRRLVAEALSVATELSTASRENREEEQFLLETFQDVVARLKDKERELAALHLLEKTRADETEALASDIIRSMTTGLVSLDSAGLVAVVNPAAERIFGIEASRAIGKRFGETFPGSEELVRMLDEALERGRYHLRGQTRYRLGEGATLHIGVSVIPLLSPSGSSRGALCLLADLTEVVDLRERLFLKENLARLGEMAAGIAHEFRNGLATIIGNAKLLTNVTDAGESADITDALLSEAQSLAHVVSEFLQFARPEPLHAGRFDLTALVETQVEELRPRARQAGVELSVEGVPIGLEGDELLLRKAVFNLVTNAIEALSDANVDDGRVVVELRRDEDSAILRVRDNGPGIAPSERERIFTPFFTLKERGTGLGLSVVQKVVVTHNGTIELEETAVGASFLVRLPLTIGAVVESSEWL